jgi:hypothetical protein
LLGYCLFTRASDLARDLRSPGLVLLGFTYFVIMIIFGVYGKKWLASDLRAHGYRELDLNEVDEDSLPID